MTRKTTGKAKGAEKKLKLKKDTLRDLDTKSRNVKGGRLVLGEKYTDDYACTAVTCFTHCDQVTCDPSLNACLDTFYKCSVYCAMRG